MGLSSTTKAVIVLDSRCPTFPSPLFQTVSVISLDRPGPPPSPFSEGVLTVKNRTCPTNLTKKRPRRLQYCERRSPRTQSEVSFPPSIFSKAPGRDRPQLPEQNVKPQPNSWNGMQMKQMAGALSSFCWKCSTKKKKNVELHSSGDESAKNSRLYFRLDRFVRLNVTRQAKLRCCFIVLIAARRRSLSFCGMMMNCGSLMCVCVCYVHTHMQRNKGCMLYSPSSSPCVPPCRTINLSFQICPVSSPGFFPTSFSFSFLLQPVEDSWAVSCREK